MNKKKLLKLIKKQGFKLKKFKVLPDVVLRIYEKEVKKNIPKQSKKMNLA